MQQCTYFVCCFMTEETIYNNLNICSISFCVYQQGKIDNSFGLKIDNRHKSVDRLKWQGEVSALFQEKRKNR